MLEIIYLSFVVASISFTVTEAKLFGSFRMWAKRDNEFLGKLCSCGYCFGYWIALGLSIIYQPHPFSKTWLPLDCFLSALVIAWLSGFQWLMMRLLAERAKI